MPKVVREDIDNLNTVLTVSIEKSEYENKFHSELSKYRKQAQMKGFRKGKTPLSILRKMYGKGILSEIINELLQQEMGAYLNDNKLNYLGQPLPNDDQEVYNFDTRELEDFEFKFDLGLAPDFEVQGLGDDASFDIYDVTIPAEKIDEELAAARKRHGKQVPVEGDMEDGDLIKLSIRELEKDSSKEDGLENEFSVPFDRLTDSAKTTLSAQKVGEPFQLNVYDLEKDTSRKYVQDYFLKVSAEEAESMEEVVQAMIVEVTRLQEAEMNEAFFEQLFGKGVVSTETEAREKFEQDLKSYYTRQAEAVFYRSLQEYLLEKNPLELPQSFLKRWLKTNNENLSDEQIEHDFSDFMENLQWTLIRSKLTKQHGVQVTDAEIKYAFKRQFLGMIGNPGMFDDTFMDSMVQRMMEREGEADRVAQQLLTDKVFAAVKDSVTLEPQPISIEDFEQVIKEINEADRAKDEARQALLSSGEEE